MLWRAWRRPAQMSQTSGADIDPTFGAVSACGQKCGSCRPRPSVGALHLERWWRPPAGSRTGTLRSRKVRARPARRARPRSVRALAMGFGYRSSRTPAPIGSVGEAGLSISWPIPPKLWFSGRCRVETFMCRVFAAGTVCRRSLAADRRGVIDQTLRAAVMAAWTSLTWRREYPRFGGVVADSALVGDAKVQ